MSFTFRPAKRERIPLLIAVAGGTGSGKTYSALRIARGIANSHPFAGVDTENGRMNHYADLFPELHRVDLHAPFRPERYTEAIEAGVAHLVSLGVPREHRVVIVDSASHEWAGDGGCLDWHDEITGGDPKKNPVGWAKVKPAHKRMVTKLLQIEAHVILCLRAEEKVEIVRERGEIKFVPKKTLPGGSLDGWVPITEKNLPYEMTASFLVMADAPGVPRPLKLEEQHKPMVPLDAVLDENVGAALAGWAAGSLSEPEPSGRENADNGSAGSPAAGDPPSSPQALSNGQRTGAGISGASGSLNDLDNATIHDQLVAFASKQEQSEERTRRIHLHSLDRDWLLDARSAAVQLAGSERAFMDVVNEVFAEGAAV